MEDRCRSTSRPTKFDRVVRREICQVMSRVTKLGADSSESYLTALYGLKVGRQAVQIGVCFIDTALGTVNLSCFMDDSNWGKLLDSWVKTTNLDSINKYSNAFFYCMLVETSLLVLASLLLMRLLKRSKRYHFRV